MTRADGLVDPADPEAVASVVAAVLRTMGPGGLEDLLTRLPGVRRQAGTARRFLTPATPASVWLGEEDQLLLEPEVVHAQVVGGVVLHRARVAPGDVPAVLARLLVPLVRAQAADDEAAVVLTAAREASASF